MRESQLRCGGHELVRSPCRSRLLERQRGGGAELEAVDLSDDVVHLYAADLAAGSPRRYVAALFVVDVEHEDEEIAAGHPEYDRWNRDLRLRYGHAIDDVFDAYNSGFLEHYHLNRIRANMGLVSSDPMAQDDPAVDDDVFALHIEALTEADWQELFRRCAAQHHGTCQ
jgi:hypothetical protein